MRKLCLLVALVLPDLAAADEFWVEPPTLPVERAGATALYAGSTQTDPHTPVRLSTRPQELAGLFASLDARIPPIQSYSFTAEEKHPQNYADIPTTFAPGSAEDQMIRFIRRFEAGAKGYDSVWYGNRHPLPARPTEMTICQVRDWQLEARNKQRSTAIGLYQIVGGTFRNMIDKMNLECGTKFDAATQDRIGLALLYGRGWAGFKSGSVALEDFAFDLAGEWAAFPAPYGPDKGKSRYWRDGNNAHQIGLTEYLGFLRDLQRKIAAGEVISSEQQVVLADVKETMVAPDDKPETAAPSRIAIRTFSR